ncbi:MAG: acyl-CoA dehydratase activase [Kiritimatiellae bacterium]|nr:acyl-CoA dehydratase activase [Kiritimatiellia bacterium]
MSETYFAGVDAGSRAIKVAIYDARASQVRATDLCDQGIDQAARAEALLSGLVKRLGLDAAGIGCVVATGYGRGAIASADTTITEISCHACGVYHSHPEAATLIDIGGQDSKLVQLAEGGRVRDFVMNDRCAAGTGRFLEIVAQRLEVPLTEFGVLAASAQQPAEISSTCAVFAESEIVGLLAAGERPSNIAAGVLRAIAVRVAAMAGRGLPDEVFFTGGVALVPGMPEALAHALRRPVRVAADPRMTAAVGAAILASRQR